MTAFEWAGLLRRNPSWVTKNARKSWVVAKAMRQFKLDHTVSSWSGRPVKVVHHKRPVSVFPGLAADPGNMIGFASTKEHYYVGHLGINWTSYNDGIDGTVRSIKPFRTAGAWRSIT